MYRHTQRHHDDSPYLILSDLSRPYLTFEEAAAAAINEYNELYGEERLALAADWDQVEPRVSTLVADPGAFDSDTLVIVELVE